MNRQDASSSGGSNPTLAACHQHAMHVHFSGLIVVCNLMAWRDTDHTALNTRWKGPPIIESTIIMSYAPNNSDPIVSLQWPFS